MTRVAVRRYLPEADPAGIVAGAAVRGRHFRDTGNLLNFCMASGSVAVPFTSINQHPSEFGFLRFWVRRKRWAVARIWFVRFAAGFQDPPVVGSVWRTGVLPVVQLPVTADINNAIDVDPFVIRETLTPSDTAEDTAVVTLRSATELSRVVDVCAYDLPRSALTELEGAIDPAGFNTAQTIRVNKTTNLYEAAADPSVAARCNFFHWSAVNTSLARGIPITSTAVYSNIFPVRIPVLPRRIAVGSTTSPVKVRILGATANLSTEIDLRVLSDDNTNHTLTAAISTASISDGNAAWSAELTVNQHNEDGTTANGIQAGRNGTIEIRCKKTGTGDAVVSAVSVYEGA